MTGGSVIRPGGAGERWLAATAPIGRVSRTMALVAGASLLGHLAVVGTVAVTARTDVPQQREIAVEIVTEVPKAAPESAKPEAAKPEPVKSEPAKPPKPESAKPEFAKPEPSKPEPAKMEPAKMEPAKTEPPKRNATKVAKAKPAPAKPEHRIVPPPAPEKDEAAEERKLASLQQELDALRAEQAQLQADRSAEADRAQQPKPAALRDTGLGLLPIGFQAVALPSTTDGAGEAASYEAIVFSALAKAKGISHRQGVPGTAGVRFSLDAAGRLVAVELITWSGIPDLDSEALALVRRAVFPPPPQGAQRTFVANVNFEVDHRR